MQVQAVFMGLFENAFKETYTVTIQLYAATKNQMN